jgi:hypothetical protein
VKAVENKKQLLKVEVNALWFSCYAFKGKILTKLELRKEDRNLLEC